MKKTSLLKYQYPLAQFLYWLSCCACSGFVAVYLQYKGFSNTTIGIVVSIYGVLSLTLQPILSRLIQRLPFLSVRKMLLSMLVVNAVLFATITLQPMPGSVTMLLFIIINGFNSAMIPLMNSFGMEYVNQNKDVNFGLSRGIGSLGWAVSAVFIGMLLEKYSPDLLGYIYVFSAGIMFINVFLMEDMGHYIPSSDTNDKQSGTIRSCISDSVFLFVALGILCCNVGHSICTTYTINLVQNVGGSESAAGLAQFFGAGSEMLGMLVFGVLIKKYSSTQILKISSIFFAVRFAFLMFASNLPMVMIGYALQGPSAGLYIPAAVYFVNDRMQPENRTMGQAVFNVIGSSIAYFIGNLIGGRILDRFGLTAMLGVCFGFSLVGCICILLKKTSKNS